MTARVNPRTTLRTGDDAIFALDMEKIHLFDKDTELTITNQQFIIKERVRPVITKNQAITRLHIREGLYFCTTPPFVSLSATFSEI